MRKLSIFLVAFSVLMGFSQASLANPNKAEALANIQQERQELSTKMNLVDDLQEQVAELSRQKEKVSSNKWTAGVMGSLAVVSLVFTFAPSRGGGGDIGAGIDLGVKFFTGMVGTSATVVAGYNAIRIYFRTNKIEELESKISDIKRELEEQDNNLALYQSALN